MKHPKTRLWHMPKHMCRLLLILAATAAGLCIAANAALWVIYRERTYPQTSVMGKSIGSTPYGALSQKVGERKLLPAKITFTHADKKTTATLDELGISKDVGRTVNSANRQRAWLPVANIFSSPQLKAPIAIDGEKMAEKVVELATVFRQDPTNAQLTLANAQVGVTEAKDGYELDTKPLQAAITAVLDKGGQAITVPVKKLTPKTTAKDLQDEKSAMEAQLGTAISLTYNGKNKSATREDIAKWYVLSGQTYTVSEDAIRAYVSGVGNSFGIRIKDISQAISAASQALANRTPANITLTAQISVKTYSYCTAAKGVDVSHLPGLRAKLKNTFADPRGWSLEGLVEYREAASGCDFTVWLSAAELMPTFGAICDSMWSCRVGPNVVINFNRWQQASPAWNAAGGALDEYRSMVINHETGHWLGFGHRNCGGAGQPAPVMQQQSIDLQGCAFNAWPVASETATLRQKLGI